MGIGLAGLAVAVGLSERPRSAVGIIRIASRLPLGEVMLVGLAAGLLGYAMLNFAGALRDPYEYGRGVRGWMMRGADAVAGAFYVALALAALRLLLPGTRPGSTAAAWAERVLRLPLGDLWLGLLAVAVLAAGVFLTRKAWSYPFDGRLDRRAMSEGMRRWTVRAARMGTAARAALFLLCGGSGLRAAIERDPSRVDGLADGLEFLGRGALGPLLLGVAATAFAAYGVYQFVKARHRRLDLG